MFIERQTKIMLSQVRCADFVFCQASVTPRGRYEATNVSFLSCLCLIIVYLSDKTLIATGQK